jgi:predicted transcriptional regulator
MNVLLSIKPKYADAIMKRVKTVEFRRTIFRYNDTEAVYLYATKPVGKVVCSFKVERVVKDTPFILWETYGNSSGLSRDDFNNYFNICQKGYAIEIKDLEIFKEPINPREYIMNFVAPQCYLYINGQFSHIHSELK